MQPTPTTAAPLRIGDAARLLGVSVATLRRWARAGRVPSTRRPSGQLAFSADDLHPYVPGAAR